MVDWVNIIHSWLLWFRAYWLCISFRESLEYITPFVTLAFCGGVLQPFNFPFVLHPFAIFKYFLGFLCVQLHHSYKFCKPTKWCNPSCVYLSKQLVMCWHKTFILRKDLIKHNKTNGIWRPQVWAISKAIVSCCEPLCTSTCVMNQFCMQLKLGTCYT